MLARTCKPLLQSVKLRVTLACKLGIEDLYFYRVMLNNASQVGMRSKLGCQAHARVTQEKKHIAKNAWKGGRMDRVYIEDED